MYPAYNWRVFSGLDDDPPRGCNSRNLESKESQVLSPELQAALGPLLQALESLSQRIAEYNRQIECIAQQSYPQTALLKQVKGVGTLIALGRSTSFPQKSRRGLLRRTATGTKKLGAE